jgi:hypothetical protein
MQMKIIFTAILSDSRGILSLGTGCESGPPPFTGPRTLQADRGGAARGGRPRHSTTARSCSTATARPVTATKAAATAAAARNLDPKPRDFRDREFLYAAAGAGQLPTDSDLRNTIREGVTTRGMPAWAGMRGEDLDALVSYIKTFSPRWQPDAAPSKPET